MRSGPWVAHVVFELVSNLFFVPIAESAFGRLGILKPGFHIERIAKKHLLHTSFVMSSESNFVVVGSFGSKFSDLCCTGNKLDN